MLRSPIMKFLSFKKKAQLAKAEKYLAAKELEKVTNDLAEFAIKLRIVKQNLQLHFLVFVDASACKAKVIEDSI